MTRHKFGPMLQEGRERKTIPAPPEMRVQTGRLRPHFSSITLIISFMRIGFNQQENQRMRTIANPGVKTADLTASLPISFAQKM